MPSSALIGFGSLLVMAASPAVAERIGADGLHFVRRYFAVLPVAVAMMFGVSLLSPRAMRQLAMLGFVVGVALLAYTLVGGVEIKGARRWIDLPGFSLQPSEFVKPCFAVVSAWLFAQSRLRPGFPGQWIAIGLYRRDRRAADPAARSRHGRGGLGGVVHAILPRRLVAGVGRGAADRRRGRARRRLSAACRMSPAASTASSIRRRGDNYQVDRSMEAFINGGWWGRGPGEGTVKLLLPDAHADFVFAVAGEELGVVVCLVIIALFAFIVLRGFSRLLQEGNLYVVLAATGLLVQFGLQAIINMASTLQLMPTKGMTLPFISYGGSSMLALGLGMGMMLALTRRRFGDGDI